MKQTDVREPVTGEVDGLLDGQANAGRRGLQPNEPVSSKEVMPSDFPLEKIPVAASAEFIRGHSGQGVRETQGDQEHRYSHGDMEMKGHGRDLYREQLSYCVGRRADGRMGRCDMKHRLPDMACNHGHTADVATCTNKKAKS